MSIQSKKFRSSLISAIALFSSTFFFVSLLVPGAFVAGQEKKTDAKKEKVASDKEKDEFAFTLENIFPEKTFFGSPPRQTAFSADGNFAAYLYRPHDERRHGTDLYVYDFRKKETRRITSVSVFAEFQESTRKVREDRIEKLKKAKGKTKTEADKDADADTGATGKTSEVTSEKNKNKKETEIDESGDLLADGDADDEKAPRYSGVSTYTWHPSENRILMVSEGDIYETRLDKPGLTRLTKTDASENQVEYLPDGTGITFASGDSAFRLVFGEHFVEQLNPGLPPGQNLTRSRISPDGKKLVIVARSSSGRPESSRTVDIIRYRDRFAKSDSIPRTVSDDTVPSVDTYVYLYDLEKSRTEQSRLIQIWHDKVDEPRDTISTPEWSLASDRVTFCFFDQKTSEVQIVMGQFPADMSSLKSEEAKPVSESSEEDETDRGSRRGRFGGSSGRPSPTEVVKNPARIVYRFSHFGGPNTPTMVSPQFGADSNHILFVSEISGFRHVHVLDTVYESVRQLTSGNYEVYPFQLSRDHRKLFARSTREHPSREMVYEIDIESAESSQIGKEVGNYSDAAVSNDGKRMVSLFVRYGQLSELYAVDEKDALKALSDSHTGKAKKFTADKPEFFEYDNRYGHKIHGTMFKPKDWKKGKKYPLLIYVYGGPLGTSHSVNDGSYSSDGYFFNNYMARTHNYITVVIDPRGQSGYGGLFEKANYEQVGKPQVEDLVDGVKFLAENYGADTGRVGIYGWSFGGFQTQMCLYTEPDVFQVGIAGAGPTEWENYNSWYTTGTVGPSQPGKPDQKKYSLRPLAKNLSGKLLLIHGIEDTNVLFQDTIAVYRELLQAGKETNVELFLDPTGGHGLGGDVKRINRYRKYEEFLLRTLGKGK